MRLLAVISLFVLSVNLHAEEFVLQNEPIRKFVYWIAKQIETPVIVSGAVDANVSLVVPDVGKNDLRPLFNQVLAANGFQAVEENGFLRVVVQETALEEAVQLDQQQLLTQVFVFEHVEAERYAELLMDIVSKHTANHGIELRPVTHSVVFLPDTNALAVTATAADLSIVSSVVPTLDKSLPQFLVKAIVSEETLSDYEVLGISSQNQTGGDGSYGLTNALSPSVGLALDAFNHAGFRASVNALKTHDETNVLSTPSILVVNREKGAITVGQNVPFIVGTSVEGDERIQKIERKDVGLVLSVVPTLLGSGEILLNVHQEVSSVNAVSQASDIITNLRSIDTRVKVRSGEMITLGGLIQEDVIEKEQGVPGLSSIPFLGRLFTSTVEESVSRSLNVFIVVERL